MLSMVTFFIAKTESDLCPSFIASSPQPLLEYLLPIGHGGLSTVDTGVAEDPAGWLPWPSPGTRTTYVTSDDEMWSSWPNV
jgi:hypothetical protein